MKRSIHSWKCRHRTITLGKRTLVMGILNVTPDSFSDGGEFIDPLAAVSQALKMIDQGADIIDIGGESTRPGAQPVSEADEIRRTIPVIEKVREQSDIPISIDTTKSQVAIQAVAAGADIINDVSALSADPAMAATAADSGAGVVLMHMRGTPRTMQENPVYKDVVDEVCTYLKARGDFAEDHGVARERIVVDPGIGFGKTTEHNLALLRSLPRLAQTDYPILIGASRKRFIGEITGKTVPATRTAGSLGAAAWAITCGAHILRVHDVLDTCDICRLLDRFTDGE